MNITHHDLDPYPIPKDRTPMFINEPWIIDESWDRPVPKKVKDLKYELKRPDSEADNIRIYVPIDLNKKAILRRLHTVIAKFGDACEKNEFHYSAEVQELIYQIEIYDQIWHVRHWVDGCKHSEEAKDLVTEFIKLLEQIPDACAECFPFVEIEYLKREYLYNHIDGDDCHQ